MALNCDVDISNSPPDWDGYLSGHSHATLFHHPGWGRVMEGAYGNRPWYLTARREGRIVGTLLLVTQRSLLFGCHLCSIPYMDVSGILSEDMEASNALTHQAAVVMREERARWVELRHERQLPVALPARTDKITFRLALPSDPDELWAGFKSKLRTKIGRPGRNGMTCSSGGEEMLGDFHQVYARNMRDLGSPPHSLRFFRLLVEHFRSSVRFFVVRQGGTTLAASLTFFDRRGVHVPWSGSDWRVRHLSPNMLLYWTMISEAARFGAPHFDFGRCSRDSGTYDFKQQWGGQEVPLTWHYILADGQSLPDLRPDSPRYRLMVACWKRLPVAVVKAIGPRIISKLS